MTLDTSIKRTALYDRHVELNARMGTFAGFEMPMWYSGIKEEHCNVRSDIGLFDLSHMGEIFIKGREAHDYLQYITCNDLRRIGDGHCQYTLFPTPEGGVVDDLIAYQFNPEEYMLVVNASNIDKDFAWVKQHNEFECEVTNRSDDYSLIAVQGPKTNDVLKAFGFKSIRSQQAFTFKRVKVEGHRIIVAGTGYTGERGFELIMANEDATWAWDRLVDIGSEYHAMPIGLGARDTLRLEMAYSLYGHELSDEISVLEANLAWTVRWGPDFIGKDYLLRQKTEGVKRTVAGMLTERNVGSPRHAAPVFTATGEEVGTVTSGSFSPSLNKGIALVLIPPEFSEIGTELFIDIRGKRASAAVCETPFYTRPK
jgi:aminomethyltransferase